MLMKTVDLETEINVIDWEMFFWEKKSAAKSISIKICSVLEKNHKNRNYTKQYGELKQRSTPENVLRTGTVQNKSFVE